MDRKIIEGFERAHNYILPESYIEFLLICNNSPQMYCEGYQDIRLCSLEELPQERKLHEMDEYCPEYIAVGYGGGGEVLIMKQDRECNTLIIAESGALISRFITPEHGTFLYDFFNGWAARRRPAGEIKAMYA